MQTHSTPRQRLDSRLAPFLAKAIPLFVAGMVLTLGFLLFTPGHILAQESGPTMGWQSIGPGIGEGAPFLEGAEVFNDDLKVSGGDVYAGDVVVYNGNAEVEGGGRIAGALYVYSGNIDIKGGGTVGGDVIAYGGDVRIHGGGSVGGDVQALGGDVTLQDGARVFGDVSVLGGDIERSPGADVRGNVLSGPRIQIPNLPTIPGLPPLDSLSPETPGPSIQNADGPMSLGRSGFGRWLWRFVLDLVKAGFFTLFVVLGSALVLNYRPGIVGDAQGYLASDPRSAFGVGLLANMVVMIPLWMWLGSLSANWFVILCLSPLLLPLGLVALAIELAGLATVGGWLGRRLAKEAGFDKLNAQASTALGVALTVGASAFLWAISACLGWLALLFVGAPGIGALVLHWRANRPDGSSPRRTPLAPIPVPDPDPDPAPAEPMPWDPADGADEPSVSLDLSGTEIETETGADFDFTTLSGIGPVFSMRLRAANVRSLGDLADMTPESLADVLNISVDRVERDDFLGQARRLLGLE